MDKRERMTVEVLACSVCGDDHSNVEFERVSGVAAYPFAGVCPKTGGTIMLRRADSQVGHRAQATLTETADCEEALRVRQLCNGHPYARIPWPHRALHQAADELNRLDREAKHWKANHDNQVALKQLASQRSDLPADRVPAYEHLAKLAEENQRLREILTVVSPRRFYEAHTVGGKGIYWTTFRFYLQNDADSFWTFRVLSVFGFAFGFRSRFLRQLFKRPPYSPPAPVALPKPSSGGEADSFQMYRLETSPAAVGAMTACDVCCAGEFVMTGTWEECEEYATDDDYEQQPCCADDLRVTSWFYRPADAEAGREDSLLVLLAYASCGLAR